MGRRLTQLRAAFTAQLRTGAPMLVYVAGLAVFAIGVAMIYLPAGLMVAGASATASAVLYVRGTTRRSNR